MLSLVAELREELARKRPRINPPTTETVDALRSLAGPLGNRPDPLVEGYAAERQRQRTNRMGVETLAQSVPALNAMRRAFSTTNKLAAQPYEINIEAPSGIAPPGRPVGGRLPFDVAYDVARTEIPDARRVAEAAGDVVRTVGPSIVRGTPLASLEAIGEALPNVPTPSGVTAEVVESAIPVEVWQGALELVPGVGTVPDLVRLVKKGTPEAMLAVRTALKDERYQPLIRKLAEERGASKIPGEPPVGPEGKPAGAPAAGERANLPAPPETAAPVEPPLDEGPIPLPERQRVAKFMAQAVERQAPIYAEQKAVESAERAQRFARVRAIRRDPTLTPQERIIESKRVLSGELAADMKSQYTPMEISDSDFDIAERMIRDSDLREGEWLNVMVAAAKMRAGKYATPGEIEKMGRVFGPDLVAAIKKRDQSIAANIARTWGVSAEDVTRAARQEELATGTGKLAPSALDTPAEVAARKTAGQVKGGLEAQTARQLRAINADIERSILQGATGAQPRIGPAGTDVAGKALDDLIVRRIKIAAQMEAADLRALREAQGQGLRQTEREINRIKAQRKADFEASVTQGVTQGGPKAATPRTEGADIVAAGVRDREGKVLTSGLDAYERAHPSVDDLVQRAVARAGDEYGPVVSEAVRYWSEGNRAILDGIGPTEGAGKLARMVQSAFSGQVTDSYVASLASRQAFLEMALLREGLDPKDVGRIGRFMFDAEVQTHFGTRFIPENVQTSIDMLKGVSLQGEKGSTTGTILEALASGSEEIKNLMFGLDLGVFGIQVRAAMQGGFFPGLAGAINRTLTRMHAPNFGDLYLSTTLERQTANMLDGLYHGRGPNIARGPEAVTTGRGLVMKAPVYGKVVEKLTEFQFGTVLGGMRDTLYEGNLLLLHVLRRDIKNPKVRARAAEWANMLTGFSNGAQTAMRKKIERAGLISPSMTRAQFGEILNAGKLLSPTADPEQRILAALAIASYGVTWLGVGKLVNDYFGVRDFNMDPTKPGAGTVTLKVPGMGETSVPFMANASLKRTFLQSLRYLAEGDEERLTNAWLRYITAREATAGRLATGLTTGRGYTPEGKFSTDLSREDLFKSLLPVPPAAQSQLTQGVNPVRAGLESFGINNYPRSTFDKADELIAEHNSDFRAALIASEGDTRDIVKYRWRQALEPKLQKIGAYVVPGEPGRSPRIEFEEWDAKEKAAVPKIMERLAASTRPSGTFNTISELEAAMVEFNLNTYMKNNSVGEKEARAALQRNFRALESVKNARANEAIYRLGKWREHPDLLNESAAVDWEALNAEERKILEAVR